jgi:glycine cleavage system H lipoate-binding protein
MRSAPSAVCACCRLQLTIARFTTDHEWVKFDPSSNIGTIGITDYAQKALGDVVFVELPESGAEIGQTGTSKVAGR